MRVEPYTVDSYLHVMKRGARGMDIVRDIRDWWRFVKSLYYLNDEFQSDHWERDIEGLALFDRPSHWPERKPLVSILAWVLLPNHFHLCLREVRKGGVSKFMQRLCGSMSAHANAKYDEKGSLFQGAFKSRTVADDNYLRYLAPYIMVKNVFEMYPNGGLAGAGKNFEDAWRWAVEEYYFSSLPVYAEGKNSLIIEQNVLHEIFKTPTIFKERAREMIIGHAEYDKKEHIARFLEEW